MLGPDSFLAASCEGAAEARGEAMASIAAAAAMNSVENILSILLKRF